MEIKIRKANFSDKEKIIEVTNKAFNKTKETSFLYRYPVLFNDKHILEYYVAENEQGELVGVAGAFKIDVVINRVVFKAVGVGKVACLKEYRTQGVMTNLLTQIVHDIKKEKFDISYLWGDRFRYGNFGWVEGGETQVFSFMEKRLPKICDDLPVSKVNESDTDLVYKLLREKPFFLDLSKDDIKAMISSKRINGLRLNQSFVFWDYDISNIMEALGNSKDILNLLCYCLKEKKKEDATCDTIEVESYEDSFEFQDILSSYCCLAKKKSSANFRIVSFENFLKKYVNAVKYKLPFVSEDLCIGNKDTNEAFKLSCHDGIMEVEKEAPKNCIMLNEKDLSEVFMGQFPLTTYLKGLSSSSIFREVLPMKELLHISKFYLL